MQECSLTLWSRNQHIAWFYVFRVFRVKAKSSFFSKIKHVWGKKMHKLSCLTKVYLCAKIETIWIFDLYHKNYIFVWFLHGCFLKCDRGILFCKVLSPGSFFPSNVTVTDRQLLKKVNFVIYEIAHLREKFVFWN